MESDRRSRSNRLPAYAEDPKSMTQGALKALEEDDRYAAAFKAFQRDMVYGDNVSLQECLPVLDRYAALM